MIAFIMCLGEFEISRALDKIIVYERMYCELIKIKR